MRFYAVFKYYFPLLLLTCRSDTLFHRPENAEKYGSAFVKPYILCVGRAEIYLSYAHKRHLRLCLRTAHRKIQGENRFKSHPRFFLPYKPWYARVFQIRGFFHHKFQRRYRTFPAASENRSANRHKLLHVSDFKLYR